MNASLLESFNENQNPNLLYQGPRLYESGPKESSKKPNLQSSRPDDEIHFDSFINGLSKISSTRSFPEQCKMHSKDIEYVCLTCREMICASCVVFGGHRSSDHEIKEMEFLKNLADSERKRFEDLLSDMDFFCKETERIYEENRQIMLDMVRENFAELKSILNTKESRFIEKINLFHDQEILKVRKQTAEDSLTKQVILRKIDAYHNIMQVENPFELLEEDPLNLFGILQIAVQSEKIERIDQKLQVFHQNIESILTNQLSALKQIQAKIPKGLVNEVVGLELDEEASLIEELSKYNSFLKKMKSSECSGERSLIIKANKLQISYPFHICSRHNLKITIQEFGNNISVLEFQTLKKIEELSQEDISFLSWLRRKLPNIQEIHLTIYDLQISDDILLDIFTCLFWKNESLRGIFLKCHKKVPFEKSILYLAENILPAAKSLKQFSFFFDTCTITNETFNSLNQAFSQVAKNLTDFSFVCGGQDVDADTIMKLFGLMPNLKFFLYQTFSEAFDDKVVEEFIFKAFSSFKNLTDFQLSLPNSQVTEAGVEKLFNWLPKYWLRKMAQFKVFLKSATFTQESLRGFKYSYTLPKLITIQEVLDNPHFDDPTSVCRKSFFITKRD